MVEEKWARIFLKALVNHIKNFDGGTKYITYGELAKDVGYPPPYKGSNFGRRIGITLGQMGHLFDNLIIDGLKVPTIQALVVGSSSKLPSEGIKEFWPQYPELSRDKKQDFTKREYKKIWDFGNRWDLVLEELGIEGLVDDLNIKRTKTTGKRLHNPYGNEGSPEHVPLRNYIASHPEIVGLQPSIKGVIEYPLKSGDQVDVVFHTDHEIVAVEVKSRRSGYDDIERGLYQTVKYKSVIEAEMRVSDINKKVKSVLVLESNFPKIHKSIKTRLGLIVLSNIKPSNDNNN